MLITLLAVNLLVIAYLLLRNSNGAATTAVSSAPAQQTPAVEVPAVEVPSAEIPTAEILAAETPAQALPGMSSAVTASPTVLAPIASPTATPSVRAALPAQRPAPAAPSRDDLLARGSSIPPAELNMHVFDPNPQARFVLLNGQRLREGEVSSEGLAVERITADGVVLRFGSSTFAVNLQ